MGRLDDSLKISIGQAIARLGVEVGLMGHSSGVRLNVDREGGLKVNAPSGTSAELRDALREYKPQVVALLQQAQGKEASDAQPMAGSGRVDGEELTDRAGRDARGRATPGQPERAGGAREQRRVDDGGERLTRLFLAALEALTLTPTQPVGIVLDVGRA